MTIPPAIGERVDIILASYPIDHSCSSVDELHSENSCPEDRVLVCTWVCFLYQPIKEIKWTPSVEQVTATMPHAFKRNIPPLLLSAMDRRSS